MENIKSDLIKNAYRSFLINKVIKNHINYKFSSNQHQLRDISDVHYFKLPYIGNLLIFIISETGRHFKTRIEEYIKKYSKCPILKHLHSPATCFDLYNSLSFIIIAKGNSKFGLKIKEALHINWKKPKLNAQLNH